MGDGQYFLGGSDIVAGSYVIAEDVQLEMMLQGSQRTELYKSAAQIDTPYLSSSGKSALIHALQPPLMAYTFWYPLSLKNRATRALVRSCFQEQ